LKILNYKTLLKKEP